jgi:hypothetical protein
VPAKAERQKMAAPGAGPVPRASTRPCDRCRTGCCSRGFLDGGLVVTHLVLWAATFAWGRGWRMVVVMQIMGTVLVIALRLSVAFSRLSRDIQEHIFHSYRKMPAAGIVLSDVGAAVALLYTVYVVAASILTQKLSADVMVLHAATLLWNVIAYGRIHVWVLCRTTMFYAVTSERVPCLFRLCPCLAPPLPMIESTVGRIDAAPSGGSRDTHQDSWQCMRDRWSTHAMQHAHFISKPEDDCVICLDRQPPTTSSATDKERMWIRLQCRHLFHVQCWITWIQSATIDQLWGPGVTLALSISHHTGIQCVMCRQPGSLSLSPPASGFDSGAAASLSHVESPSPSLL